MNLLILLSLVCYASAGFFGLFGGKKEEVVQADRGSLGPDVPNIGADGSIVEIPLNDDGRTRKPKPQNLDETTTRTTRRITTPRTTTMRTTTRRLEPITKELPSQESHHGPTGSGGCPSRIDAYAAVPSGELLFDGSSVYTIRNNRVESQEALTKVFPRGPDRVHAAVYDSDKEWIVLFSDRQVYAYRKAGWAYTLDSSFPKALPESIAFSPNAAIRWHDGHQMVLSNGGKFALYDEYWNKSQMTGRTASYFENLPDDVRGISEWKNGHGTIFTRDKAFDYSVSNKRSEPEGTPIQHFLRC